MIRSLPTRSLLLMYFVAFLCVPVPIVRSARAEVVPDPNSLVKSLQAAEQSLVDLHVEKFKLLMQSRGANAKEWTASRFTMEGDAWYNGRRNSLARVNLSRSIMEWTNGAAPWIEQIRDIGFDGQTGRVVNHSEGPESHLRRDHTGLLLPDAPPELTDRYLRFADGTAFCLNFYDGDGNGNTLSSEIRVALDEKAGCTVAFDSLYGEKVLKVSISNGDTYVADFWVEPDKGYALRKAIRRERAHGNGDWVDLEITNVTRIVEAGQQIWFPLEGSSELDYPGKPGTKMRLSFVAQNAVANDPHFDRGIFTIPFPEGYFITDRVHGGVFRAKDGGDDAGGSGRNATSRLVPATTQAAGK